MIYSLDQYEDVYRMCWEQKIPLTPQMFGCKDFNHGPDGKVNYWHYLPLACARGEGLVDLTPRDTSYDFARDEAWKDHGYDNFSRGWDRSRTYGELMAAWASHEEFN